MVTPLSISAQVTSLAVVSELLAGTTLREARAAGALPVRKAVDYALQIANGLATAHEKVISKGHLHRDIKPENLCITSDGRVQILDFGIDMYPIVPSTSPGVVPAVRVAILVA
ncbi:MAG: protein kinase [Acidobacteria bacterium]|nr:protein kinase [Acidobacteriota bacterium]MCA1652407.1 protein kinase [Acidobacteriota bacterium]